MFDRVCDVQRSPRHMLIALIGTLLELCENPQAVASVQCWRGEGDTSAPQLLLQIWRSEEEDTGVTRDRHRMITGTDTSISLNA